MLLVAKSKAENVDSERFADRFNMSVENILFADKVVKRMCEHINKVSATFSA